MSIAFVCLNHRLGRVALGRMYDAIAEKMDRPQASRVPPLPEDLKDALLAPEERDIGDAQERAFYKHMRGVRMGRILTVRCCCA